MDTYSEPAALTGESNRLHLRYPEYEIGRWTYGGLSVLTWGEGATLTVGSFTSIADGVKVFLGGEHRTDWQTTFPFSVLWKPANAICGHPKTKGDVVIGNDVWIGAEAMIMSGVTVGDGAVIGARSLVAKDVEPYAIVAGNPALIVRKRFSDARIERLLRLKWWDWTDEKIVGLLPWLLATDTDAFLDEAERRHGGG